MTIYSPCFEEVNVEIISCIDAYIMKDEESIVNPHSCLPLSSLLASCLECMNT